MLILLGQCPVGVRESPVARGAVQNDDGVVLDGSLLQGVLMEFPMNVSLKCYITFLLNPTVTMNILRTALCRHTRTGGVVV